MHLHAESSSFISYLLLDENPFVSSKTASSIDFSRKSISFLSVNPP
jgi:hypothetical protein